MDSYEEIEDEDGETAVDRLIEEYGPLPELVDYVMAQGTFRERDAATMGKPPWPEPGNPMFDYLVERATSICQTEGVTTAMLWAVAHGWYEGGLDASSRQSTPS